MVDIENEPKDADKYRHELKQFITTLESHYGVKPIIYTYKKFHDKYIDNKLAGYPLWIARYNTAHPGIDKQWIMWQCTENGELPGIREKVDINIFNGSMEELEKLRIK
jgi:lysozyme